MKLKIIIPVNTSDFTSLIQDAIRPVLRNDIEVHVEPISKGTPYIQSRFDLATNAPHVIELAKKSEKNGFDGIFVTDMDMCGVEASREVISIPIIGGFRASAFTAMMLGQRFSLITVENVVGLQNEHIREFGITDNLASIRPLSIRVPGLVDSEQHKIILNALIRESLCAISNDGADAIIFGCTGFINYAIELAENLRRILCKSIPVLDPNCTAICYLDLLVRNRLSQSQIIYPLQKNNIHTKIVSVA